MNGSDSENKELFYFCILSKKIIDFESTEHTAYQDLFSNILDPKSMPFWMDTDVFYLFDFNEKPKLNSPIPFYRSFNLW